MLGFSVPPAVVKEVEHLAKEERRTKSELFREMVRVYHRYRRQRQQDEDRWIMNLVEEVKAEEQQRPTPPEELAKEDAELVAYGARQARKLGIKPKDINALIHAYRKRRQA